MNVIERKDGCMKKDSLFEAVRGIVSIFGRALVVVGIGLALAGCPDPEDETIPPGQDNPPPIPEPELPSVVTKLNFAAAETVKTITISDLTGQDVYLVKVNKSDDEVNYGDTGHAYPASSSARSAATASFPPAALGLAGAMGGAVSGVFTTAAGETITRYDHAGARAFNSNPPSAAGIVSGSSQATRSALDARAAYTVGASTKTFWVEDAKGKWIEIGTTLRSTGTNSNIWVADANFSNTSLPKNDNKITTAQAAVLATKFDEIYRYETPLFGYEYGGGVAATAPTYGGVDGDPKIQILVYDIDYDYTTAQTGGTLGYFWSKDLYDQKSLDGYGVKTNQAEMFYIDAHFMDAYPTVAHSVLAHEFQHMINFNVKSIRWSTNTNTVIADVWYNEMLSMLAEDVIGPLIGIAPDSEDHVIADRMGSFLAGYLYSGVTDWLSGNDALYSYSSVYAFGAYLARNFGGAKLIKAMMENDTTNEASITAALTALNPGVTFKSALSRYGEALVYSGAPQPDGVLSFDKTATTKINATDYTFTAFNIWTMPNNGYGQSVTIGTPPDTDTYSYPEKGPMVWTLDYLFWMPGNSVILQSTDEWQHVTGALKITAKKPTNANIELYLMVR